MKKLYLFAAAALTLAACTDEAYLGENKEFTKTDNPIGFNMSTPAMSRADITGKNAADKLGSTFYVYGIKNETGNVGTITTNNVNNVMNNYVVKYVDGSDFTTTSNTAGWEYVGYTLSTAEQTNVTPNGATEAQTIKYWDWGATDYTFTAITAAQTDVNPTSGDAKVKIEKINAEKDADENALTVYDQGYKISIYPGASTGSIYIADRVNIAKSENTDRTAHNIYGGQVNFKFRNLGTQVRAAMYETVPGYTVTIDKMYNGETTPAAVTNNFVAAFQNSSAPTSGTTPMIATVTYYDNSTANAAVTNQPKVTFSGAVTSPTLTLGDATTLANNGIKKGAVLGETIDNAIYDLTSKGYTMVLPNEANTNNMTITVDYTLTCTATGEKIYVKGASAVVPAQYLKWKPNFSYTYMFKISDNTNGHTDPSVGPAGLYPITFDAVVVDAGDGIAEYITTVSEPSITTFGVDATSKKYVKDADAYAAGTDIYATVMAGTTPTVQTLTLGTNANLYTITPAAGTADSYITEAAVAEYLAESYEEKMGTTTPKLTTTLANTAASETTTVPGEDGVNITFTSGNALKVANAAAGWYAVEYITEAATPAQYPEKTGLSVDDDLTGMYYKDSSDNYVMFAAGTKATTELIDAKVYTRTAPVAAKAQYKVFKVTE